MTKAATKVAPAKAVPKKTTQSTLKPKAKLAASKKRSKPVTDDENSSPENVSLHDALLLSSTPPSAKRQKKTQAKKQGVYKPLAEVENEASLLDEHELSKPKSSKASDEYQKVQ